MKQHKILQIGCYMFVLGLGVLFCFVPACKFLESKPVEEPIKIDTEDVKDPAETDAEDDKTEDPVETDDKTEDPVETDAEDDKEDPVEIDEEDVADPVETDAEDEEAEDTEDKEAEDPAELRYAENTLIFFRSGRYRYIARVTKNTDTEAKDVPVYIFVAEIREEVGDSLTIDEVRSIRQVPPKGWGTRRVALEYFENAEWTFSWDVQEMENHYLLPGSDEDKRRVEFTQVRFRIPVQR